MKNTIKNKAMSKLKIGAYTLSENNLSKITYYAKLETRGNRSAWLDKELTLIFKQRASNPKNKE